MIKKLWLFLIALCILGPASGAEVCVNLSSGCIFDAEGKVLCAPGKYISILPAGDMYICVSADTGETVIADREFSELSRGEYTKAEFLNGCFLLKKNGLYALADRELNLLTGFEFTYAAAAGDGFAFLRTDHRDDIADLMYICDGLGNVAPTGISVLYADITYSCGLAPVMQAENGLWGYIDTNGTWAINPEFKCAGGFCGGAAVIGTSGGMGLIDTAGNILLSPYYSGITLTEHFVLCRDRDALFMYRRDETGLVMFLSYEEANASAAGEYIAVYTGDYVYLYNDRGENRGTFTSDTLIYPSFGKNVLAADTNGVYIYDPESLSMSFIFDEVRLLSDDGLFVYYLEGNCGLMRRDGRLLTGAEYTQINMPAAGYVAAETDNDIVLFTYDLEQGLKSFASVPR